MVPAVYARALFRKFGRSVQQRAALLANAGLSEPDLDTPGAETPVVALTTLAGVLTRTMGESWPLEAATVWSAALQGALDVALRSASTLDRALETAERYAHVRAPYIAAELRRDRTTRRLTLRPTFDFAAAEWRAVALAVALAAHAMFAQILEDEMGDATMTFPWPAPPDGERIRSHFSCHVQFGAREFAFVVPARLASRAPPSADPALYAKAIGDLEEAARRRSGDDAIVAAVEHAIRVHLPQRQTAVRAARRLGLSHRTLVRRLALANTDYRGLLEGVLRERAADMLANGGRSREEMAAALGYADPTSFSRACRRWFGARKAPHV